MGGGCDVFSAYSYYKYLSNYFQTTKESPTLFFGNCLGLRDDLKRHKKVSNYLYEVHNHDPMKQNVENKHYGTTKLEESIPFEYDKENDIFHGPYLFAVPVKKFSDQINNIKLATVINNEVMSESYKHLDLDLIIGIDNGGDSLTCGIDYTNDPELARDRQVLYSMKNNKYNIPYINYVFGPGCDGESTVEQLQKSMHDKENKYLGQFQLNKELMEIMRERAKYLTEYRTPNIMYAAFNTQSKDNTNESKENNDDDNDKNKETDIFKDMVTIQRGKEPRVQIPRLWLYSCWVFSSSKL